MAIVRPNKAYLQKTPLFLRYRITAHRNLLKQLFPPSDQEEHTISLFDLSPDTKPVLYNKCSSMYKAFSTRSLNSDGTVQAGAINL